MQSLLSAEFVYEIKWQHAILFFDLKNLIGSSITLYILTLFIKEHCLKPSRHVDKHIIIFENFDKIVFNYRWSIGIENAKFIFLNVRNSQNKVWFYYTVAFPFLYNLFWTAWFSASKTIWKTESSQWSLCFCLRGRDERNINGFQ